MENLNSTIENLNNAIEEKTAWFNWNKDFSMKSSNAYLIISGIIFAFSILATIFLYASNSSIDSNITETNSKIKEFTQTITDLKNNNQISAYNIIKDALPSIEKSINESKIQNYVAEVTRVSRKYKIDFNWFSYANKNISTSALAASINNTDAVQKISDFIKDYRVQNDKNIFALNPVSAINWDSLQRTFQVNFTVK